VAEIVKKSNARMELLRKVAGFGVPVEDLKNIYFLFVRSLLEQSATVWHSSLTQENEADLERVQKSALRIMLQERYLSYEHALKTLDLETLKERRRHLCMNFALKCLKNQRFKDMFPLNNKSHEMDTSITDKYEVQFALTDRLKDSPVI
jgi:hypothetical protein